MSKMLEVTSQPVKKPSRKPDIPRGISLRNDSEAKSHLGRNVLPRESINHGSSGNPLRGARKDDCEKMRRETRDESGDQETRGRETGFASHVSRLTTSPFPQPTTKKGALFFPGQSFLPFFE